MIVDAHHYFRSLDREAQRWMTDERDPIRRMFGPAGLESLLEHVGVGTPVLVQAACTDSGIDSMFEHAAEHAWIDGVIAWMGLLMNGGYDKVWQETVPATTLGANA